MNGDRSVFNGVIAGGQELDDLRRLDRMITQYPWFPMAKALYFKFTGKNRDKESVLCLDSFENLIVGRTYASEIAEEGKKEYFEKGKEKPKRREKLIEDFLSLDLSRLSAEIASIKLENVDLTEGIEDNLVTEEVAEAYLRMGDVEEAVKIYNALSLKFPEKSTYFAELLKKLNNLTD